MTTPSVSFDVAPQTIIDSLAFGHCLFFGFFIYAARNHNPANVYLAAFMFVYAIVSIGDLLLGIGLWPSIKFFLLPFDAFLPPLIYLYVVQLTSPLPRLLEPQRLRHLLAFGIALVLLLPWMTLPAELKNLPIALDLGWFGTVEKPLGLSATPEELFNNVTAPINLLVATIGLLLFVGLYHVQVTVYVLALVVVFLKHQKGIKQNFSYTEKVKLQWLGILCVAFILMWATVVPVGILSFTLPIGELESFTKGAAQLGILYMLGFIGMRQSVVYPPGKPWVLAEHGENKPIPVRDDRPAHEAAETAPSHHQQKYARSGLSKEDVKRIAAKLDHAMRERCLFLDSMLTLPQLAKQTGIPANHITQVINEHLGKNFFDFVNGFRVEEAMRELVISDKTILETAFAVGFNSKSTFNATFKKAVGQTPSQFRSRERTGKSPDAVSEI